MTVTSEPSTLTHQQMQTWRRDGYYIARGLFDAHEVAEIRDGFMKLYENGPIEGLSEINPAFAPTDPLARWPRVLHPHAHPECSVYQLSRKYMLEKRVRAILFDLFGQEPVAAQSMFYFKPAGARGQDLHQDNFYLQVRPGTCMAAWLAVDDADEDNGGLMVVPGSHNLDLACPEQADNSKFFTTEHVSVPPGMELVPMNMKAGDVLFFNGSVIHGSYPNSSRDRFRRAFICHYMPSSGTEISSWYRTLLDFDGNAVNRATAAGGGPCGNVAAAPH